MSRNKPRIGQELLDVPMGDMIREMALSIAEGQMALDANSIDVAEMMGGLKTITDDNGNITFEDSRVFFGKERITYQEAVQNYNESKDAFYKGQIETQLAGKFTEDTSQVKTVLGTVISEVYKTGPAPHKYEIFIGYDSNNNAKYQEISEIEAKKIKLNDNLSGTLTISIPQRLSMMELGFTPTFYQFVDTIIEVKIAIKYTHEASSSVDINRSTTNKSSRGVGGGIAKLFGSPNASKSNVSTSQVNASYSQKYSYSAEGSSLLRTKLVPIPPPAVLEERIRKMMEEEFTEAPAE